jgi:alpha-glucoside transport system substrate-binding protein
MAGRMLATVVALSLLLLGCGSPAPELSGTVRVLVTWTGDELAAFRSVVAPFEERTGVSVDVISTRDLRGVLDAAMDAGDPPDLAGLAGPAHMRELAARGVLQDLGEILDMGRYRADVAPTFIDLGTVDGRLVGVFVRSSAKGLIWFSPKVFRLGAPRTWDELERMATQASRSVIRTWCLGLASDEASGWPGTDLVEQFMLRASGPEAYDAWVEGRLAWDSPEVRDAFERYAMVAADGAVYGGTSAALQVDFRAAGDPLFDARPGCLFLNQGSFMPTFFTEDGHEPLADFDFFAFPPLREDEPSMVIGGGDLMGVLTPRPEAAELLRYLVSDEAQSSWVSHGGSLSVKSSVTAYPDTISRRAAALLSGAEVFRFDASDLMPADLNSAFWQAVLRYTADPASLDDVLAELEAVRREGQDG